MPSLPFCVCVAVLADGVPARLQSGPMERPIRFEHFRYLGDKRAQVVYDVDALDERDSHIIEELLDAETFACFAPDTVAEARNRGYRLWWAQRAQPAS